MAHVMSEQSFSPELPSSPEFQIDQSIEDLIGDIFERSGSETPGNKTAVQTDIGRIYELVSVRVRRLLPEAP